MKRIIIPIVVLVLLGGCAQKTESENQYLRRILTSTKWQLEDVWIDDVSYPLYQGLEIGFTSGFYTAVNGEPIWLPEGRWDLVGFAGDRILLDNALSVAFEEVGPERIRISFNWQPASTGGRVASLGGQHIMSFKPKRNP